MPVKKAVEYFIGTGGNPRLDCGQAVAQALKEEYGLSEEFILSLASSGFGKAPAGVCGALYAVKLILRETSKDTLVTIDGLFSEHAGSKYCLEIRRLKKVSCVSCVKKAVRLIMQYNSPNKL